MSNSYYNNSSYPQQRAKLTSATMRAEFLAISQAFDKVPNPLSGGTKGFAGGVFQDPVIQAVSGGGSIDGIDIGQTTAAKGTFSDLRMPTDATLSNQVPRLSQVNNLIATHAGAADPHTQYVLKAAATDITFTGTGRRLKADTANGTAANQFAIQDSGTNTATIVNALPSGTNTNASFVAHDASTPGNTSYGAFRAASTEVRVESSRYGTGTYLPLTFYTNNAEAGRFDTGGNFMVGVTSAAPGYKITSSGPVAATGYATRLGTSGAYGGNAFNINWTGTVANFYVDTTLIGAITITSDRRLKEAISPFAGPALDIIRALRPVHFRYLSDPKDRVGFIADELAEQLPQAVDGEANAPNQYQSLRTDAIAAVLVSAVQQLERRLAAIETHLAAAG